MDPDWSAFTLAAFDRPLEREHLLGFVLGCSKRLTLIQYVDTNRFELDGYCVFRNRDVRRWREVHEADITARALRVKKLAPKRVPQLKLESWPDLLESAQRRFPLLVVFREIAAKNVCQVGRLSAVGKSTFALEEIDPDAKWEGVRRYKFSDLTRVDFGGAYEDALRRVAAAERPKKRATRPIRALA